MGGASPSSPSGRRYERRFFIRPYSKILAGSLRLVSIARQSADALEVDSESEQVSELRFLDRYYSLPPVVLAVSAFALGAALERFAPGLGTSGFQMLIWAFFISTVVLYHGTFTVNSLAHIFGKRRFATDDNSRNNWFVALITLGEGWHNNHHHYAASERQGFFWWEIDISHYTLKTLSWLGIVWDLHHPPADLVSTANALSEPPALAGG